MTEQLPNYRLGDLYNYPNRRELFKLSYVERGVFVFDCGHRVTHNVFIDMVNAKTKIQVIDDTQLLLFNNQ
jgi:hypothetical protein